MATNPQVGIGGIHDIYTSSNLKSFLGNRIECEINFFPLHAPFSLLVSRFVVSPSRPAVPIGWEDCVDNQAADRAHDHAFDRLAHFVPSPVPCLSPFLPSRSSHPSISLPFRHPISLSRAVVPSSSHSLITRPASLPAVSTSRAGRNGITAYSVSSSHVRRLDSWNVVERREKGKGRLVS